MSNCQNNALVLEDLITNLDWYDFFETQYSKNYWKHLTQKLANETNFYPPPAKIFHAFNSLSPQNIKIVILGQDPYHQKGQADGLAFSSHGAKLPASLKNIFSEIFSNNIPTSGNLQPWAQQGVLLLNSILTVKNSSPLSHKNFGWQKLTQEVLKYLDSKAKCFMLWGQQARQAQKYLKNKNHYILKTSHPSPLSTYRGFTGCKHFQKANSWLQSKNQQPIAWCDLLTKNP